MSGAEITDPDDMIVDGIANYAEVAGDLDPQAAAFVYRPVADTIHKSMPAGEQCKLAFPAMIIRPDVRTECFVAIFESTLIVAWQKGLFRKKTESEVIATSGITSAQAAVSTASSTRGALLMTVEGTTTVTFALPQGRTDIGDAVRAAVLPRTS